MKAHADFSRGVNLIIDPAAIFEYVRLVEHRGASRPRQLRQPHQGAQPGGFRGALRPNLVVDPQPGEEVDILCLGQIAGQGLVEVMMRIDQAGQDYLAGPLRDRQLL